MGKVWGKVIFGFRGTEQIWVNKKKLKISTGTGIGKSKMGFRSVPANRGMCPTH